MKKPTLLRKLVMDADVYQQLDGRVPGDVQRAMRKLMERPLSDAEASNVFPYVVKNVGVGRKDVKRMVYTFLATHADLCPDEVLLAVNAFQKEMESHDSRMRALALRVLSAVRVPVLLPLQVEAIRRCATDSDPHVRQCAALAMYKVHSLDHSLVEDWIDLLVSMVQDVDDQVFATVILVFHQLASDRLDRLHPYYGVLCERIPNLDSWGQSFSLRLIHRYARRYLLQELKADEVHDGNFVWHVANENKEDVDMMLRVCRSLLMSQSPSVVLASAEVLLDVGDFIHKKEVGRALVLSFITAADEMKYVLLRNILSVCDQHVWIFEEHIMYFYPGEYDKIDILITKLKVLEVLANSSNASDLLKRLQIHLSGSHHPKFKQLVLQTIGRIGCRIATVSSLCMRELLQHTVEDRDGTFTYALDSIQMIYKSHMKEEITAILTLASCFSEFQTPTSRSRILDMLTLDCATPVSDATSLDQHLEELHVLSTDIVRQVICSFTDEGEAVKLQVLTTCAKLALHNDDALVYFHTLVQLAEVDDSIEVRDRARFLACVVKEGAQSLLQENECEVKLNAQAPSLRLSTLSLLVGHHAPGYTELPSFSGCHERPCQSAKVVSPESKEGCYPSEFFPGREREAEPPQQAPVHTSELDINHFYDDVDG